MGAPKPFQQRDALHGPRAAVRKRVRQKSRHRSVRTAPEKISGQRLPRTGCRRVAEAERARPPQERQAGQGARRQNGAGRQEQGSRQERGPRHGIRAIVGECGRRADLSERRGVLSETALQPSDRKHAPGMDALHRAFPQRLSRGALRGACRREPLPGGGPLPGSPQGAEVRLRPAGGAREFRKSRQRVSPEPVCRQGRPGAPGHGSEGRIRCGRAAADGGRPRARAAVGGRTGGRGRAPPGAGARRRGPRGGRRTCATGPIPTTPGS